MFRLLRLPRVERVTQTVADVVDREHGDENHHAGPEGFMWRELDPVLGVVEHPAPGGDIGGETETEKRERRFCDDRGAYAERGGDDDRAHHVRQDVLEDE